MNSKENSPDYQRALIFACDLNLKAPAQDSTTKLILQAMLKDIPQFSVDVGGQRRTLLHKAALFDKPL